MKRSEGKSAGSGSHWEPLPADFPSLQAGEVHIFRASLRRDPAQAARDRALLAPDERARADRFIRAAHAREWSAARAALRSILSQTLRARRRPLPLRLGANAHGKPHLLDELGERLPVRFNLSHSGHWALCALTLDDELGVDVEWSARAEDLGKLARYAFSRDEFARWEACEIGGERAHAFFRIWSRKEAYIKALGLGLSLDLKAFDVSLEAHDARLIQARHEGAPQAMCMRDLSVDAQHAGALVVCRRDPGPIFCWDFSPGPHDH